MRVIPKSSAIPSSPKDKYRQPLRTRLTRVASLGLTSLVMTGIVIGVRQAKGLQSLELAVYDRLVAFKGDRLSDPRLLIVGISEADLRQIKSVPIADSILAKALLKLQSAHPRVIGLDIHRDIPQSSGDKALNEQLAASNVIVIRKGDRSEEDHVLPPAIVPDSRVGFSDLLMDADNVIRRYLLFVELSDREKYQSFALRVALKYLEDRDLPLTATPGNLQIGSVVFKDLSPLAGGYHMDKGEMIGWQTLLKYRSANKVARQVTLTDVLSGQVPADLIRDRVVLIGYTAPSVKDVFITPYSILQPEQAKAEETTLMPGVTIHAQMVSQILNSVLEGEPQIWFLPEWGEWLWILAWSLLGGALIRWLNRPFYMLLSVVITLGGLWGICVFVFSLSGWLPAIPAALGFLLTGAVILGQKAYYSLYHDVLTDLPNRRLFLRDLEKRYSFSANVSNPLIAVLFLDLDRFKMFNEGLGNQAGDQVLLTIAWRLRGKLQGGERLARIGGDEFAIGLFPGSIDRSILLAKQLQEAITQPIPWQEREIYTSASIGIAIERIERSFQPEEILRDAHIAMGSAKVQGGNRYEIFTPRSKTQAEARLQLETELRRALDHQEFQLYYQPIISLKSGKVAGFEALIRWQSASRGLVSPAQFIPITEETGIIIPLGQWILQEACQQIREWHRCYPRNPPLMMSVNLSSRQFSQPDLVQKVLEVLQSVKIDRKSLKLEITEGMMMNNVEEAIDLLQKLKDLGLRLSIDDFGTGYSNLSYLHRFPVDTLKVDQSFVRRLHEDKDSDRYLQIIRTVVTLGHNLALDIIAEGIETEAQMLTLKSLDCEYGQGYYFSRPIPKEEATKFLERDPCWE